MIAAFIVGCEIGFWVFVLAGLLCRYVWNRKRLGGLLLLCTPLVDVALLVATVIDLRSGATAGMAHGIAAIYIGVSIVFGHQMVKWADVRFAHRFAGGPEPAKAPKHGSAHARHQIGQALRHAVAWIIGVVLLFAIILITGDESRTAALSGTIRIWSIALVIDLAYSFSYLIWPKKEKGASS